MDTPWLTVEQAAEYLQLAPRTIKRYLADGTLPYTRIGDGKKAPIRINFRDLDNHLLSRKTAAQGRGRAKALGYQQKKAKPEHRAKDWL